MISTYVYFASVFVYFDFFDAFVGAIPGGEDSSNDATVEFEDGEEEALKIKQQTYTTTFTTQNSEYKYEKKENQAQKVSIYLTIYLTAK